ARAGRRDRGPCPGRRCEGRAVRAVRLWLRWHLDRTPPVDLAHFPSVLRRREHTVRQRISEPAAARGVRIHGGGPLAAGRDRCAGRFRGTPGGASTAGPRWRAEDGAGPAPAPRARTVGGDLRQPALVRRRLLL